MKFCGNGTATGCGKPTLFIHIGFPKTGTSTLQAFLCRNRDHLRDCGVFYPGPIFRKGFVRREKQLISPFLFATLPWLGPWRACFHHYRDEIRGSACRTNILSCESLHDDDPDIFKCFRNFDIKILCYFRDVYSYSASVIKQEVKTCSIEYLFDLTKIDDVLHKVERYIELFGRENCIFKNYNELTRQGRLVEDFMETVGIPHDPALHWPENANATPSDAATMFLYQCAFLPLAHKDAVRLRNEVLALDLSAYGDFRCTLLLPQSFAPDDDVLRQIRRQGELLQDPHWFDFCMAQREKYAAIENHDLPAEVQRHIFDRLSQTSREALLAACPQAGGSGAVLPSMKDIPPKYMDILVTLRREYILAQKAAIRQYVNQRHEELQQQAEAEARAACPEPAPLPWRAKAAQCFHEGLAAARSPQAREILCIRRSGMFDISWYWFHNPDVLAAGIDPVVHYVSYGAREGRNPAPWFDTIDYEVRNPDVAASGINPFYHYLRFGVREGRQLA